MHRPEERHERPRRAGDNSAGIVPGYALRRAIERSKSRSRLHHRVSRAVRNDVRSMDPLKLKRKRGSGSNRLVLAGFYLALAVAVHVGVAASLAVFNSPDGMKRGPDRPPAERVTVRVFDAEPPKADKAIVRVKEPEPNQAPEARPETPSPAPRPQKQAKRQPIAPPDPVDPADAPPREEAEPRRRVIGISFESTVSAGRGPSFAVGNTRMGATDSTAQDPSKIGKLGPSWGKSFGGSDSTEGSGPNRAASNVPGGGAILVKPIRISRVSLDYPSGLKARGLEGNVVMLIRIDQSGKVASAKVIGSSGYEEFDEAARRAAAKEVFKPAMRGGEPVEYNLKYTYRFRIRES